MLFLHLSFPKWIIVAISNFLKFQRTLFALLNLLTELDSNINFSRRWENLLVPELVKQFWCYSNTASFAYRKECNYPDSMMEKKITSHLCCCSCGCGFIFMVLFQLLWPCSCCSHVAWSQKCGFSIFSFMLWRPWPNDLLWFFKSSP